MTKLLGFRWALALLACGALNLAGCSSSTPGCTSSAGCAAGQICECGACAPAVSCPVNEEACSDTVDAGCSYEICTDITTAQNCGGCAVVCGAGKSCVADGGPSTCQ